MYKIGVIGAGAMGIGVAQNFAQFGYEVILIDLTNKILENAREKIINNLRFFNMLNKNKNTIASNNVDDIIKKIKFTINYEELIDADFIVENVSEILDIKKEVYEKLEKISKDECIYIVNTSCISITKIGAMTNKASKVIGVHFMNPVPLKKTVEIINGYHTSNETINRVKALLSSIEKDFVIVSDSPGFVSNRISHLFMNEAAYIIQENIASAEDVDNIFKKCYEHKMGPLETADLIGIDVVVNSLDILYESYKDSKFRCCPLLRKMVDAGFVGRKSGKGFYEYF